MLCLVEHRYIQKMHENWNTKTSKNALDKHIFKCSEYTVDNSLWMAVKDLLLHIISWPLMYLCFSFFNVSMVKSFHFCDAEQMLIDLKY